MTRSNVLDRVLGVTTRTYPAPRGETVTVTVVLLAVEPRGSYIARAAATTSHAWTARRGKPLTFTGADRYFPGQLDPRHYREASR